MYRKFFVLLILMWSSCATDQSRFAVSSFDIRGKLVFSEINYKGSIKTNKNSRIIARNPDDDFVEIENISDDALNLRGMIFGYGNELKTIKKDAPLLPGSCFVIAHTTNGMLLHADLVIDDFTLSSNAIHISLLEGNARDCIDSVSLGTNVSNNSHGTISSLLRIFGRFGAENGSDYESWHLYNKNARGIRQGYAVKASPGFSD